MSALVAVPKEWPAILLPREATADPTDIVAAVKAGAFAGLQRAMRELGPAGTTAAIAEAGLRGRGGAGRPAADKWRAATEAGPGKPRYVVANGYGADPSSGTDRMLLESNPYAVIEGAAIAAFAIGAEEALVAVRATDTEAVSRLEAAAGAARESNYIGDDALDGGRRLDVVIRPVQGAFMLGEETVLLKALDGKRGQPEQRPPYPTTKGFRGAPTVVHNVQTLAAVPWILRHRSEAFLAVGTGDASGTVLVDVRGPESGGIAEVPLGTPLRTILRLVGVPAKGRSVKAVLVGGPTGGILPASLLDTPYTFDDLRAVGAHVGSGSILAADDRACVVDLARILTRYAADEACGKTIPCRIGLRRMAEIGERLTTGHSRAGDLELLTDLSADITGSALCDHERLATLPLMSGLRYFRAEVDAHFERGECPAGVCRPIRVGAGSARSTRSRASTASA